MCCLQQSFTSAVATKSCALKNVFRFLKNLGQAVCVRDKQGLVKKKRRGRGVNWRRDERYLTPLRRMIVRNTRKKRARQTKRLIRSRTANWPRCCAKGWASRDEWAVHRSLDETHRPHSSLSAARRRRKNTDASARLLLNQEITQHMYNERHTHAHDRKTCTAGRTLVSADFVWHSNRRWWGSHYEHQHTKAKPQNRGIGSAIGSTDCGEKKTKELRNEREWRGFRNPQQCDWLKSKVIAEPQTCWTSIHSYSMCMIHVFRGLPSSIWALNSNTHRYVTNKHSGLTNLFAA